MKDVVVSHFNICHCPNPDSWCKWLTVLCLSYQQCYRWIFNHFTNAKKTKFPYTELLCNDGISIHCQYFVKYIHSTVQNFISISHAYYVTGMLAVFVC